MKYQNDSFIKIANFNVMLRVTEILSARVRLKDYLELFLHFH
jgi:hypothetical protein